MLSQTKWVRFATAILVVLALLCGSTLAKKPPKDPEPDPPPVMYTITWLDSFAYSWAEGINSHGHVVGEAQSPERYGGESFAYVYTPETGMVDLNTLLPEASGWHLRWATDINDRGQIVGQAYLTGVENRIGFRYTPAVLAEDGSEFLPAIVEALGPLHADEQRTIAWSINERGEVCGNSKDASGQSHVWFYSDEVGMVTVMSETEGESLSARRINESSRILVSDIRAVEPPQRAIRVFPFSDPEYFYSEGDRFEAWDMNDSGHFVGVASFVVPINKKRTTTEGRAFCHDGNTLLDLGAGKYTYARGINNHGDVVGYVGGRFVTFTAFIYYKELQQVVNLDTAVVVGNEKDLLWFHETSSKSPRRINEAGQIIGNLSNFYLGQLHPSFVLTPIPPEN